MVEGEGIVRAERALTNLHSHKWLFLRNMRVQVCEGSLSL